MKAWSPPIGPPWWAIACALLGHALIGWLGHPTLMALVSSTSRSTDASPSMAFKAPLPAHVRLVAPSDRTGHSDSVISDRRLGLQVGTQADALAAQNRSLEKNQPYAVEKSMYGASKMEANDKHLPAASGPSLTSTQLPPSLQIHFVVHNQRSDMPTPAKPARAVLRWQLEGSDYNLQLDVERFFGGPRSLRSEGTVSAGGLVPQRYSERGRGEQAAHLDGEEGIVRFSNNRPSAVFEGGMQDRLSVVMQLSAWLAANASQLPPGSQVRLPAVGLGTTSEWLFDVNAADPLELPAHVWDGRGQVRKLSAQRRHEFDVKFDVWLGESTQPSPWLPMALRLQRINGDWMFMELASPADTAVPLDMRPPPRRAPDSGPAPRQGVPPEMIGRVAR